MGVTVGIAVILGGVFLLAPRMGSDLSAQVARAEFFTNHGTSIIDFRWYGGINQFGYSLLSQPVMALLGVWVTGALALVASAVAFAALLLRAGVPRPMAGSLVGVICITGNLVSGRVTYALGVAFGLAALLALTLPAGRGRAGLLRYGGAAAGALLASATSPVAGLFVGLAGAALLLSRRYLAGGVLGVAAAAPMAVTALLFGDGGWMNISRTDTVRAIVASLAVAALVSYRPVRVGALLSAAGVLLAALVHTPVGLNATRLGVMFALPLLAAAARLPAPLAARLPGPSAAWQPSPARAVEAVALVALLGGVCWAQPPVVTADLRSIGAVSNDRGYYLPLVTELRQRPLAGRVEIPPTQNYWEATYLAEVPLARGWLRQADIGRNPLFFETVPGATGTGIPLTVESYRDWLADNAVQYVAVPDAKLSWVGRAEAQLIEAGLPYLTLIWSNPHWQLYAVADPVPIVAGPATLVEQTAAALTFEAPAAGPVPIRVRYSRWLTVDGGATLARDGEWTVVTTPGPGRYRLSS
ncbi:MAG TPA: hypothetical protein VFX61_13710 [Micromonosporaceae bacterium]|nr:hypothetical protein [Micromonosporaceae bacterium]